MFRIDSYNLSQSKEFVSVRVWSLNPEGNEENCGILVFTPDEWLAFVAALSGRRVVEVDFRGVEQIRDQLRSSND